jgi:hypothetical protein
MRVWLKTRVRLLGLKIYLLHTFSAKMSPTLFLPHHYTSTMYKYIQKYIISLTNILLS